MMNWEKLLEQSTRSIFGLICHQNPLILMSIDGRLVLLCPRCMGLHLGFITSFIVLTIRRSNCIKIVKMTTKLILATAIGTMVIEWGIGGYIDWYTPNTFSRLATGLICGSALSVLLISYKHAMICYTKNSILNLNSFQLGCLICFSFSIGITIVYLSSWIILSSILLFSVIINALLAIHTISLILKKLLNPRKI